MDKPVLTKVKHIRVFEQAVEQLRSAILGGEFGPDNRLPTEQELGVLLGVGRSTVRETLRVLEAEGLITVRRGSGAYVATEATLNATRGSVLRWLAQRQETVQQILQVRESIEGLTARLTAQMASTDTLAQLRQIVAEMTTLSEDENAAKNADQLADLDVQFHLVVSAASGNDIAHEIVSHIVPAFSRANRAVLWVGWRIKESVREHDGILRAIEAGNLIDAENLMREHVVRVYNDLNLHLSERSVEPPLG